MLRAQGEKVSILLLCICTGFNAVFKPSEGYLLALWTTWTPYFSLWEEEGSAPKNLCWKKLKAPAGFWHISCTGTF